MPAHLVLQRMGVSLQFGPVADSSGVKNANDGTIEFGWNLCEGIGMWFYAVWLGWGSCNRVLMNPSVLQLHCHYGGLRQTSYSQQQFMCQPMETPSQGRRVI